MKKAKNNHDYLKARQKGNFTHHLKNVFMQSKL